MKNKLSKLRISLLSSLLTCSLSYAGVFQSDFNAGVTPSGSQTFGNAVVDTSGGVGGSGVLKVTTAGTSQQGSFIVNDIAGGAPVTNFTVKYKLNLGGAASGGRIADGMSFCFAADLPNGTWGEEGAGTGLIVSFDTWDNAGGDTAPAIEVKYNGGVIATQSMAGIRDAASVPAGPVTPLLNDGNGNPLSLDTSNTFINVAITLKADGTLDVFYKDVAIFSNLTLTGYSPFAGGRFGWGARTGGAVEDAFIDNLLVAANFTAGPVSITSQPQDVTVTESQTATFSVGLDGTPPFTIQWFSNSVAIAGANGTSYSTVTTLGMNGTLYRADITNPETLIPVSTRNALLTVTSGTLVNSVSSRGQLSTVYVTFSKGVKKIGTYSINNGVTVNTVSYGSSHSEIVLQTTALTAETTYTLTVTGEQGEDNSVLVPNPTVVQFRQGYGPFCHDFNDNALPPGTSLGGVATMGGPGGNDGSIHLTDDGQLGACGQFSIPNLTGGQPIANLQARWRSLISSAGAIADGYSFNWGADVPVGPGTCAGGAEGAGSGLSVTVDTFDNGCGDCATGTDTGVEIKWKGNRVAYGHTSKAFLGKNQFVDASVTVTPSGVATFTYDGVTISANLPNFGSGIAGNFSFTGVTGGASENAWIDDICINNYTLGPIFFTQQPVDTTGLEGQPVTFTAAVDGSPPYYFQWKTNGAAVPGATASSFTIAATTGAMEGMQVSVVASNDFSSATSTNATLHVLVNPRVVSVFSRKVADVHVIFNHEVHLGTVGDGEYQLPNTGLFEAARVYGSSHKEVIVTFDPLTVDSTYSLLVSDVTSEAGNLPVIPNPTSVTFRHGFGAFCANFDDNTVPAGSSVAGTAAVSGGFLHLTDNVGNQSGQFFIDDRNGGQPLDRLLIKYRTLIGAPAPGTRIADGVSLNVASDLGAGFGEDGTGSGLTISFDTWDNAVGDTAPAFEVRYHGSIIATQSMAGVRDGTSVPPGPVTPLLIDANGNPLSLETSNVFVNVLLSVDPDGKVDLYYKDYQIFKKVQLPNYTPFVGARVGFGARTGGAAENAWIDDFCLNGFSLGAVTITQQPADVTLNEQRRNLFTVGVDGLPPYASQWYSNNVPIAGATGLSHLTPPLNRNQNGDRYFVIISNFCGFVTSQVATVTIIPDNVVPHILQQLVMCGGTNLALTFDKTLDAASANNAANYSLNNGHTVTSATLQADGKTVLLRVTPPLNPQDAEFLTVNNVKDSSGFNTIPPNTKVFVGVFPVLQAVGPQNMIVFEAEDYDFKASGAGGHNWVFNTALTGQSGFPAATGTFSGRGDMEALPNSGTSQGDNNLDSPRLDYCVTLPATGPWFVWLRYVGPTGSDDSVHIGIDGVESPFGHAVGNNVNANRYEWNNFNNVAADGVARFTNNTAGPHVFSIWMREDGTRVDKILLTTDPTFTFSADITVMGPDSTPRSATPRITLQKNTPIAGAETISWPGTGWRLQGTAGFRTPPGTSPWLDLPYPSGTVIPPGYFGTGNTNVEFRLIAP